MDQISWQLNYFREPKRHQTTYTTCTWELSGSNIVLRVKGTFSCVFFSKLADFLCCWPVCYLNIIRSTLIHVECLLMHYSSVFTFWRWTRITPLSFGHCFKNSPIMICQALDCENGKGWLRQPSEVFVPRKFAMEKLIVVSGHLTFRVIALCFHSLFLDWNAIHICAAYMLRLVDEFDNTLCKHQSVNSEIRWKIMAFFWSVNNPAKIRYMYILFLTAVSGVWIWYGFSLTKLGWTKSLHHFMAVLPWTFVPQSVRMLALQARDSSSNPSGGN